MVFNSYQYLMFLPLVVICYYLIPHKFRWFLLLVASYYFYMVWNPKYVLLIIFSTLVDYIVSIKMSNKELKSDRKKYLYISLIANLGLLFLFKYFNFFNDTIQSLAGFINPDSIYTFSGLNLLLPMGISFYTFQTLSYTIDVYRGDRKAERHLGYFALYVTYFPQLVAGPIERSNTLIPNLKEKQYFDYDRTRKALLKIGYGFFKKIVVADRLAVIVNTIYNDVGSYSGVYFVIATVFFAFQIYCDFSAYSDIAIGSANLMGHNLMENFKAPYFAKNIKEFWARWHISLTTWFRDYLYIPLGGNRCSKSRYYVNVLIIFLVSGLWHGANFTFIVWGAIHGFLQIFSYATSDRRLSIIEKLGIKTNTFYYRTFQQLITFMIVCFAWIFFRANTISDAIFVVQNISFEGIENIFDGSFYELGLDKIDFIFSLLLIPILLFIDNLIINHNIFDKLLSENLVIRWGVYIIIIFTIILFGYYGGYDESNFIYFQF